MERKVLTSLVIIGIIIAGILIFSNYPQKENVQSASYPAVHTIVTPTNLNWVNVPSLPPGAKFALIEGNLSNAVPFTARIRFPPNYNIPAHRHPAIEHVTVLSGEFNMGLGDRLDKNRGDSLPVGSFVVIPPNTNHFAWTTEEETIIQIHGVGPWGITYADSADDPRNK